MQLETKHEPSFLSLFQPFCFGLGHSPEPKGAEPEGERDSRQESFSVRATAFSVFCSYKVTALWGLFNARYNIVKNKQSNPRHPLSSTDQERKLPSECRPTAPPALLMGSILTPVTPPGTAEPGRIPLTLFYALI